MSAFSPALHWMGNGEWLGISDEGLEGDVENSGVWNWMGCCLPENFRARNRIDYKFWTPDLKESALLANNSHPYLCFNPITHCTKTIHRTIHMLTAILAPLEWIFRKLGVRSGMGRQSSCKFGYCRPKAVPGYYK